MNHRLFMVELWLVVEPQVNNRLYWAKEFFYSASFSVEELNEIGETEFECRRFLNVDQSKSRNRLTEPGLF